MTAHGFHRRFISSKISASSPLAFCFRVLSLSLNQRRSPFLTRSRGTSTCTVQYSTVQYSTVQYSTVQQGDQHLAQELVLVILVLVHHRDLNHVMDVPNVTKKEAELNI